MKILLYSLFGLAVFFVAVFLIKPDNRTPKPLTESETPADLVRKEVGSQEIEDPGEKGPPEKAPVGTTGLEPRRRHEEALPLRQEAEATGMAAIQKGAGEPLGEEGLEFVPPSGSPFGDVENLDFPPLSAPEYDDGFSPMPMEELSSGAFERQDMGSGKFNQGDQPFGKPTFDGANQPTQELEWGQFDRSNPFQE